MKYQGFTWTVDELDPMMIVIKAPDGEAVMNIFIGEAMETAGKTLIKQHVQACDSQPWVDNWHNDTFAKKSMVWKTLTNQ